MENSNRQQLPVSESQPDNCFESNDDGRARLRLVAGIAVVAVAAACVGARYHEDVNDALQSISDSASDHNPLASGDKAAATASASPQATPSITPQPTETALVESEAQCIADMPLASRVGQIMMPGFYINSLKQTNIVFKKYHIKNGIVMGDITKSDEPRLKKFLTTNDIAASIDDEGGLVQRSAETLASQEEISSTYDPAKAKDIVAAHAEYLRKDLGITFNASPVVDVNRNNGSSGTPGEGRTFEGVAEDVTAYGEAYVDGLTSKGINPMIKHFPGHGRASGDTHVGAATTPNWSEMKKRDIIPFKEIIKHAKENNQPLSVMVGHLIVPGLTEKNTPASLSPQAMDYLRKGLKFNGVIVTDSLTMGAALTHGDTAEAAVKAITAGADMALYVPESKDLPNSTREVSQALTMAVKNGTIPEKQLNQSVGRVLRFKAKSACE